MTSENPQRVALSYQRIISGAVELADQIGIEPLTIRKLSEFLGTKPMSIYHYLASKEEIIDGMVTQVFQEIGIPDSDLDWRNAVIERAHSMRTVLKNHPWAIPLMESRSKPSIEMLQHHDSLLGIWFKSGFPSDIMAHGVAGIDAFVFGFVMQETSLPLAESSDGGQNLDQASEDIVSPLDPTQFPNLVRFTMEHVAQPGYDFGASFEPGLKFILDGLEALARKSG